MNDEKKLPTKFASAERAPQSEIEAQAEELSSNNMIKTIFDAFPDIVLILNQHRQIVFINQATAEALGLENWKLACGLRPGEALQCEHSKMSEGGCGTSEYCVHCGAAISILLAQQGKTDVRECRITHAGTGTALDLKVKAAPFEFENESFVMLSVLDISSEKAKEILQRIFLHDISNTVHQLIGFTKLLKTSNPEKIENHTAMVLELSGRIADEIKVQNELIAAESGELQPEMQIINSLYLLEEVITGYRNHEISDQKTIVIDDKTVNIAFQSDKALLSRILSNLIKNALEATDKNESILAGCEINSKSVRYYVNNPTPIPENVQLQLFKRSFSTKGPGRGLGTYSVKLLTEKYLNGTVYFISNEKNGTTFFVTFPCK